MERNMKLDTQEKALLYLSLELIGAEIKEELLRATVEEDFKELDSVKGALKSLESLKTKLTMDNYL